MASSGSSLADRVPPHNLEAEQSLLGSMFLSSEAVETCLDAVDDADFSRSAHSKIFAAIKYLYGRGEPVDQITVADRLLATGDLDAAGGKPYLLDITGMVPTAANAIYYAEIVKRTSLLRQLIEAGTSIVAIGYENPDDIGAVIEQAEKRIFDVTNKRVSNNFRPLDELMKSGFEQIEKLYDRKEHITGVPTGFPDLDKILAGLHAGDLIILAARPSVGKTAFALNMAVNAAKEGYPTAVFSLEMSSDQLVQRILCAEARIDSQRLRTGYLNDSDWPSIMQAMGRLGAAPLWVDDTPAISILEVRAKARRLFRDKPQGLIIVDYLQLMQPQNRRSENRQVEIAEISRGLKILAKELHVPIVALSQLSRAVEQRTSKRPMLSDLRESGAIEQDADVVMFIHRETIGSGGGGGSHDDFGGGEDRTEGMPAKGEAEIIVAKHRNGPVDSCYVAFLDRYTKFAPLAKNVP
ncbi:MAG: replicative DNA helicase [Actinobacteria bacterium HGW-Actinobacteria-6]|nr:MAG: replicative DNA helicase [Actinobacteria bacterium HGW-Actinobacteria-6]